MSPGNMKINPQVVKNAVKFAREQAPYSDDTQMMELQEAKIGAPLLAHTPQGEPSFWLVPLLAGDWACGFATVDLQGQVMRMGFFGGTPKDRDAWVKANFFKAPPVESLNEIAANYPGKPISAPVMSYDSSPAKWGWKVSTTRADESPVVIFITPGGWYAQRMVTPGDFEG